MPRVRISRSYATDELRRAYMPGSKRIGQADVSAIGLTYMGARIAIIEFRLFGGVAYYEAGKQSPFASFNKDGAALDD